jgi:hypothetical protein
VQLVAADTGPIDYLLLIGHIEILPALFGRVILPSVVKDEMANPKAPLPVRDWIGNLPVLLKHRQLLSVRRKMLAPASRMRSTYTKSPYPAPPPCPVHDAGRSCPVALYVLVLPGAFP